jgi:hypothetical protein
MVPLYFQSIKMVHGQNKVNSVFGGWKDSIFGYRAFSLGDQSVLVYMKKDYKRFAVNRQYIFAGGERPLSRVETRKS